MKGFKDGVDFSALTPATSLVPTFSTRAKSSVNEEKENNC
jgi:hypothetical protein